MRYPYTVRQSSWPEDGHDEREDGGRDRQFEANASGLEWNRQDCMIDQLREARTLRVVSTPK